MGAASRFGPELGADAQGKPWFRVGDYRLLGVKYRDILGGAWVWGKSGHPPYGPAEVRVDARDHPILRGHPDFAIDDEVYGDLALAADIVPLMRARADDGAAGWHPMLWERRVGHGRVVYDALGHDEAALSHVVHRRIVARGALWALGRATAELDAA
ncbi:MAG: ThuA domain-containing protein [Proteobacteria bacterium]|nr:ThuA domain-containing protein [Pseudomonadota bacterium]